MDLDEYFFRTKKTARSLANESGLSLGTIGSIRRRQSSPKLDVAVTLHLISNGQVDYEEMIPRERLKEITEFIERLAQ